MMNNVLQNLVELTRQRDHLHLETSILFTLARLADITGVRALEFHTMDDGQIYVRPRAWTEGDRVLTADTEGTPDVPLVPLSDMPRLQQCIESHAEQMQHVPQPGVYVLWLPVWMNERIKICFEITQSVPFTPHGLDVLLPVFQLYQNYQSLLDYSERDALTGLLNRKTFDEYLLRFATSSNGEDACGCRPWLAVMDIDHFKQVNDRFGHLFGDEVLILVSRLLQDSFGPQDKIFRFGGEEFVLLLHPMSATEAEASLNRFRQRVESYTFPQVGQVTISIGFAGAGRTVPVELLGRADQALYYAKAHGRNQVCHFESLQSQGLLQEKPTQVVGDIDLF